MLIGRNAVEATATATKQQATMTPPPPPSAIETTSTSSSAAAATAAAAEAPPSTEDPQDECVLCCYPLPIRENESLYKECCGEVICRGCIVAQQHTLIIGTNVKKPIAGSKEEELEFIRILASKQTMVCPFCRAEHPSNDKEYLKRLWKRIDEYKDPRAMQHMADLYKKGENGLSKNLKKTEEFYQQAYDLGDPTAAFLLAGLYTLDIPDPVRVMKYLEEGVKRGDAYCMINMGVRVAESGNHEEAKRRVMMAACSGCEKAMNNLMENYRNNPGSVVCKDDLATTLRDFKVVNDKRKSEPREYAIRYKVFEKGFEEKVRIDDDYTILQYFNSRRHTSEKMNQTDFLSLLRALARVKKGHGGT